MSLPAQTGETCDVLVLGAGLAGLCAAIVALRAGARVTLACQGDVCSGSSFSPATWGLGLVTPGRLGPQSLAAAMGEVGCGRNDPRLSATLCREAEASVGFLESVGGTLERPSDPGQREFVPCFDHELRSWHGFRSSQWRGIFRGQLDLYARAGSLTVLRQAHPLSLLVCGGAVRGCLLWAGRPVVVRASQTVVATGGYAGLWGHRLCADQNRGLCHVLALDAGAALTNLDCMQLMLGCAAGGRTFVHNEKVFGWTRLLDARTGQSIFELLGIDPCEARRALELHATHGPYTTRLGSRLVEESLARFRADFPGRDVCAVLDPSFLASGGKPEFVESYFAWLREATGLGTEDALPIRQYAHSCNGGIAIDPQARTGVPGLLACGEAAGGVHGQDRIGGLASTTAVTFGRIAGMSAAEGAGAEDASDGGAQGPCLATPLVRDADADPGHALAAPGHALAAIGGILDEKCLVGSTSADLDAAEQRLSALAPGPAAQTSDLAQALALLSGPDAAGLVASHEARLAVRMAREVVRALAAQRP